MLKKKNVKKTILISWESFSYFWNTSQFSKIVFFDTMMKNQKLEMSEFWINISKIIIRSRQLICAKQVSLQCNKSLNNKKQITYVTNL